MGLREFRSKKDEPEGKDVEKTKELQEKLFDTEMMEKLRSEFTWAPGQPGPEKVFRQAEARGIDADELIKKMNDRDGTGWERWKWYRNLADSYGA